MRENGISALNLWMKGQPLTYNEVNKELEKKEKKGN